MIRSSVVDASDWRWRLDRAQLGLRLRIGQLAGDRRRPDPALGFLQPARLDVVAILEVVSGDGLAIDAPHRREVVVVPGQAGRDQQHDDGRHDHEAETDIEIQVAPVVVLPRRSMGTFDDGLGSEGHVVR